MIKENIKPIIIGVSFILGIIVYTERTKYEVVHTSSFERAAVFTVVNKTNGETVTYVSPSFKILPFKTTLDGKIKELKK